LYGSVNWTIKAGDTRRMTAAEIKYIRKTTECTWKDKKTNTEIAKERNITPVFENIEEKRRNWLQRINNVPHNR
jgi:hypothetical protein